MATIGKPKEQRRGAYFYRGKGGTRRGCFTEFSLARLLLGKEKFFLPPAGVCKVSCFLLGSVRYTSYGEWYCVKVSPSGLPNSIINEASFIFKFLPLDRCFFLKSTLIESQIFRI